MEIEFVSKRVGMDDCEACLKETRKTIKELFDFADCSTSGSVTAE